MPSWVALAAVMRRVRIRLVSPWTTCRHSPGAPSPSTIPGAGCQGLLADPCCQKRECDRQTLSIAHGRSVGRSMVYPRGYQAEQSIKSNSRHPKVLEVPFVV
ncbi:unnamed protein product [Boreogadus saida]